MQELQEYIRNFNSTQGDGTCRLHVYVRKGAPRELGYPIVLRFGIRDILVVFVKLVYDEETPDDREGDGVLVVETITAFGPREQARPSGEEVC